MRRTIHAARTGLLALAVSGALGFGASAALAKTAAPPQCTVPWAAGTCRTTSQCRDICASLGTNPTFSECRDNCCYCDIQ